MSVLERRLTLTTGGEVIVHFLEPEEVDEDCWRCDYRIQWPDRQRRFHGSGVDGVQALKHAMCNARGQGRHVALAGPARTRITTGGQPQADGFCLDSRRQDPAA